MRVGCAILAAGAGVRFGGVASKLIASMRDKPLLQWAIDAASASSAVSCSVILGARAEEVAAHVDLRRCAPVVNVTWSAGMASSIGCAVAAHGEDRGLLLMLGDQPNVTLRDLDRVIACFAERPDAIVMLRRGDVWGAPAVFPRSAYAELRSLRGDEGAKRLAMGQSKRLIFVEAEASDAFADVDVRADLAKSRRGS